MSKPTVSPLRPFFSSGPCAKRPDWSVSLLQSSLIGRSHRSREGKSRLKMVIEKTRKILAIPDDYKIGIVPGSDTGAVEMALWSMLGARGVDMLCWESFGAGWVSDVKNQLKLDDMRVFDAPYGQLPDLNKVDCDRDVVFTWNGTTSGVKIPNGNWIPADRKGLTIVDATSAAFAMDLPWDKIDVATWSWQKILGGEAAHGMIVLSPRAVERLETYIPAWPLPKIFRMTKGGKLIDGIFSGATINTPSMICVEDVLDALCWSEKIGGLKGLIKRSNANLTAVSKWVAKTSWIEFLCEDDNIRSNTSICLKLSDTCDLPSELKATAPKKMAQLLDKQGIAFDINGYRDAPAGLRIWGGATVDSDDMEKLMPWIDWAYNEIKTQN